MGRRDNFYKTLAHETPEQLVMDLGTFSAATMEGRSRYTVMDFLGLPYQEPSEERAFADGGRLAESLLQALDIDTRGVGSIMVPRKSIAHKVAENIHVDEWGVERIFTGQYWDITKSPLSGATVEDLEKYPWPDPMTIDPKHIEAHRERARDLWENTDYVVCAEHPVYGVFELGCWMCGFDDFLLKLALDQDFVRRFFDIVLDYQKKVIDQYYGALGPYIHYTSSGDDFGTQTNTFMAPQMFADLIAPYLKERIAYTKQYTQAAYLQHSCGNIFTLLPHLIDAGVEIMNPIQPVSDLMSPANLKNNYGSQITFHGGIDTQAILPKGDRDSVREAVKSVIEVLGENGGYIFAAAHSIQDDVPPENLVTMFQAAREFWPALR